jgi:Ala-tRNA(Pro) deacylase
MSAAYTVENYLSTHHIPYEIVSHPRSVTSLRTASAAHIQPDRMAKAVVLEYDDGYMLAVLPANCHVKLGQLRRVMGRDLRMATEYGISRLFPDCDTGAVPPVGYAYGVETVWDESLMEQPDLYFEAGDHESLMHVNTKDFIDMMGDALHGRFTTRIM